MLIAKSLVPLLSTSNQPKLPFRSYSPVTVISSNPTLTLMSKSVRFSSLVTEASSNRMVERPNILTSNILTSAL